MSEILRLDRVRKTIGEGEGATEIVKGVSLAVESGEFIAIMGSSGSGKSTILNIIGLLDPPTSGSVSLMGRDVSTLDEAGTARLRSRAIGFVFQHFHLLPYLTAAQNVMLPLQYAKAQGAAPKARTLLERVGLGHRLHTHPATLSGGEKQRV
ncbi:MAG: ATP-binding cassette domain-containing protein, partial [Elusimicrobia bacterium]|nr:ATP-binding cassette domain-containing protein [Elusimicrobiota bacterium]